MSDELGQALLRQDSAGDAPTAQLQAERILARDRRRIWIFSVIVLLLWLLAIAVLSCLYWGFLTFYMPRIFETVLHTASTPAGEQHIRNDFILGIEWGNVIVWTTTVLLVAAIAGTILLVFLSRRLTLRQLSSQLAALSREMKELQSALDATRRQPPK